jgi:hypothetical protein
MSNIQKARIVAELIGRTYGDHIASLKNFRNNEQTMGRLEVIFQNKPDQKVVLLFTGIDTWDKIKNKIQKLIDSDGICVVCCEKQKGKKKIVKRPCNGCDCGHTENVIEIDGYTEICQSCCEYVCLPCLQKNGQWKCAVCRQCIHAYAHIMHNEVCDHVDE